VAFLPVEQIASIAAAVNATRGHQTPEVS